MTDPKRCPFCNSPDAQPAQDMNEQWFVHCRSCNAHGPRHSEEEAARQWWNCRAQAGSHSITYRVGDPMDGETAAFLASIVDKKAFDGKLDRSRIEAARAATLEDRK